MNKAEQRFIGWLMLVRILHEKYMGCKDVKLCPKSWKYYYELMLNPYDAIKADLNEQR